MFAHSNSLAAVRDCRKQNSTGPYQPLFATMLDGLEHKKAKQSGLNRSGQSVRHSLLYFESVLIQKDIDLLSDNNS